MQPTQFYQLEISKSQAATAFFGRILISFLFFLSAFEKVIHASALTATLTDYGLPAPVYLLGLSIFIEFVGALALLTGVMARVGAVLLIYYLIAVTLVFHNMWAPVVAGAPAQLAMTAKNLAVIGGLFLVAAFGPGPAVVQSEKLARKTRAMPYNSQRASDELESAYVAGAR